MIKYFGLKDEAGEEGMELGGEEVGENFGGDFGRVPKDAGMGGGGLDYGALYGGKPAIALFDGESGFGSIIALEERELGFQSVDVGFSTQGLDAVFIYVQADLHPTTLLAHHHQSYIDVFFALYVGNVTQQTILIYQLLSLRENRSLRILGFRIRRRIKFPAITNRIFSLLHYFKRLRWRIAS